eukprot:15428313-Heterocapsa_arctica.AAC.1
MTPHFRLRRSMRSRHRVQNQCRMADRCNRHRRSLRLGLCWAYRLLSRLHDLRLSLRLYCLHRLQSSP